MPRNFYLKPAPEEFLEQGDIFYKLPFPSFDPQEMILIGEAEPSQTNWNDAVMRKVPQDGFPVQVRVEPVWGVVASQNCDAANKPLISFFEIHNCDNRSGLTIPEQQTPKWWATRALPELRKNQSIFLLPPDELTEIKSPKIVSFDTIFQVPKLGLLDMRLQFRIARLPEICRNHYREAIAHYFTRYAYDEWYVLDRDQYLEYGKAKLKKELGRDPTVEEIETEFPPSDWQRA